MRQIGPDLRQPLILAALPGDRLARLRGMAVSHRCFWAVDSWADAVEAIRVRPVVMAIVDPLLGGPPRTHEIERLRLLFPSLPLLVYTVLAPETAGALLALGGAGIRRAMFFRLDDSPEAMRRAVNLELEGSASQRVVQSLGRRLPGLPDTLLRALELTLHAPADLPTVSDLARRAQLSRRTCERIFSKLDLPSPGVVMLMARLLYAHHLLLDPGYTVEDVALKLGFGKARTLQMHFREVFGLTAGELRLSMSVAETALIVTERYLPLPAGAVAS